MKVRLTLEEHTIQVPQVLPKEVVEYDLSDEFGFWQYHKAIGQANHIGRPMAVETIKDNEPDK